MRKWVKAIICGCLAYELSLWLASFLVMDSQEWVQLLMKLTAQVSAIMCGMLVLLLYDKEEG